MPLTKHIEYLIQAASLAEAEDQELKKKHGIEPGEGVDVFASETIDWLFEDRPEARKIEVYLEGLEYDTLLKLEVLMYLGRDGGTYQEKMNFFYERKEPKEEIIRTIIEKRIAYPTYFVKAIENLKQEGIDIESL